MRQSDPQIFLHHVRRNIELSGDLVIFQSMLIFHVDSGLALGRQLREDFAQSRDSGGQIEHLFEAIRRGIRVVRQPVGFGCTSAGGG